LGPNRTRAKTSRTRMSCQLIAGHRNATLVSQSLVKLAWRLRLPAV
jgi:hypothetical protein